MRHALVLFIASLVAVQSVFHAQRPAPRVFVHTEPDGEQSELAARLQSVKDLTAVLATKRERFTLVEARDKAQIVIEILDRSVKVPRVVIGMGARPGQPPGNNAPARTVILRVRVTEGPDEVIVTNKNTPLESARGWKSAAEDIVKQVEKLIYDQSPIAAVISQPVRNGSGLVVR